MKTIEKYFDNSIEFKQPAGKIVADYFRKYSPTETELLFAFVRVYGELMEIQNNKLSVIGK